MTRGFAGAAFAALLFAGCASLSPAAQRIQHVNKSEVGSCKFLSVVYGGKRTGELFPKKTALEDAANRGATHVVTLYDQGGKFTADAYNCDQPREVVAEKDAPPPAPIAPTTVERPVAAMAAPPAAPKPKKGPRGDWVVAVMNVESRKEVDVGDTFLDNVVSQLRITIATFGVRTVDQGAQTRALEDQIGALKRESYKGCYDDKCQIELGKALAASHILRTNVTRFGRVCVLNGELIDLKAEVAIGAASAQGDCTEEGFLTMIDQVAERLVAG